MSTSLKELNAFWRFEKEALNGSSIQKDPINYIILR